MILLRAFVLFTLVTICLPTFFSCKQEPTHNANELYLALADSIIKTHNASLQEWEWAIKTYGRVQIITKNNRIEIQHIPEQGTEIISYFLQNEVKSEKIDSVSINRAEVIFLGRGLLVNSLMKKETMYYHLETDEIPSLIKEIGKVKYVKGFGLGERKINLGSRADQPPYCACDHASTPPGNCKAGQKMELNCASANDFGSCKVTCIGQTYACCDRGFE
ncbi:MAG TPA: hypothetical protein VGK46_06850 [Saprospiraceae bacterium]|jgi:hypothetical protein